MFEFALVVGIYSYIIFFLGIFGVLYKNVIVFSSLVYFLAVILIFLRNKKIGLERFKLKKIDKISKFLIFIISAQAVVNLIGALGSELSFDALWYHLTIPKIFLLNHSVFHIPGNLLYYSDMPKLIEMLYVASLSVDGEVLSKIVHFSFGLLCVFAVYKLSRLFLSEKLSLMASLVFYTNLVVDWQSITAYIDLGRTFFEVLALFYFLKWVENREDRNLLKSSIMLGFSISAKVAGIDSLIIFCILIFLFLKNKGIKIIQISKTLFLFIFFSLLIPMPWFLFSFLNTGNPVYPLFSKVLITHDQNIISAIFNLFLFSSDPISPIYLIFFPLVILFIRKYNLKTRVILLYFVFAVILWSINSQAGGSRFILPYLPAISILSTNALTYTKHNLRKYLIFLILVVSMSSIFYRFVANYKYFPVITGRESKSQFLSKNLNFSFGDFYDTDNYFKTHIRKEDKVLLFGFHNLYYVDFPFIDSSWVRVGDRFNYIAVQNSVLPSRFSEWKLIYYNKNTLVKLYSNGGETWVY